jgi:hypothetical protein
MRSTALLAVPLLILPTFVAAESKLVSPPQIAPAPLQPPIPGAGEVNRQPEKPSAQEHQATQTDSRGTIDAPLIVEMHYPPQTDRETAKNAAEEERKASADRWTIGLTAALVIGTIMQFCALGYQGYWVRRTVKSAERSLALIERALLVCRLISLVS